MGYQLYETTSDQIAQGQLYNDARPYGSFLYLFSSSLWLILLLAVAPWFSPGRFGGGAYLTIHKEVGDLIDWVSSTPKLSKKKIH